MAGDDKIEVMFKRFFAVFSSHMHPNNRANARFDEFGNSRSVRKTDGRTFVPAFFSSPLISAGRDARPPD